MKARWCWKRRRSWLSTGGRLLLELVDLGNWKGLRRRGRGDGTSAFSDPRRPVVAWVVIRRRSFSVDPSVVEDLSTGGGPLHLVGPNRCSSRPSRNRIR